jgi:hypothetical protein
MGPPGEGLSPAHLSGSAFRRTLHCLCWGRGLQPPLVGFSHDVGPCWCVSRAVAQKRSVLCLDDSIKDSALQASEVSEAPADSNHVSGPAYPMIAGLAAACCVVRSLSFLLGVSTHWQRNSGWRSFWGGGQRNRNSHACVLLHQVVDL